MPSLSAWPRPPSPGGLHQHANVGSYRIPKSYGSYLEKRGLASSNPWFDYLRQRLNMGLHKVISEPGYGSLDYIAAVHNAGLMPVVRFQPDGGGSFPRMGVDRAVIRALVGAGAIYYEPGNEPDNIGEWDGSQGEGGKVYGWPQILAMIDQFMHNASEIIAGGGIAMIPAMNAGYPSFDAQGNLTDDGSDRLSYRNFLAGIDRDPAKARQLRAWADQGKIATAVHNRPSNHPLDYPDDPTSLRDIYYFQNLPWWKAQNPQLTRLQADSTCFRSYELMDDLNLAYFGFSLPMIATEAGYTIEVQEDSRYPKIKDGAEFALMPEIYRADGYQDFTPLMLYTEDGHPSLRRAQYWSHSDMNIEILRRFTGPKAWRPSLFGVCFYHAIGDGGGDSTSEGWYGNGLLGRDLAIIKDLERYISAPSPQNPPEVPPKPVEVPVSANPQIPQADKDTHMPKLTRKAGIHLNSDIPISDEDWQQILEVNARVFTVTSFDWGIIHRLRDTFPECIILGRFYGYADHTNWDLPWDNPAWFVAYGRWCAAEAYRLGLDIVQWANEPQIDSGLNVKPDGFAKLAAAAASWLDGWLSAPVTTFPDFTSRPGTVPLSPGNHEDDDPDNEGYRGGDILEPVYRRYKEANGVLILHNYWTEDPASVTDRSWGLRNIAQRAVYKWEGSWIISECNEGHNGVPGDRERQAEAEHLKTWISNLPMKDPNFLGFTWFELRSKDEAFKFAWLSLNQWARQAMSEYNNNSEVSMPEYRNIPLTIAEAGIAVAGQSTRFVVTGKPGAVVQGQTVYPRGENDTALATDKLIFGQIDSNGQYVFDIETPTAIFQGKPSANYSIHLSELSLEPGTANPGGFAAIDFAVTAFAVAPADPPAGPNPEQPGATPDLSSDVGQKIILALVHTFANAGDMFNSAQQVSRAAINSQQWVQYAKGEIDVPPPDFR